MGPRFGTCTRRVITGYGILTSRLVTTKFGLISNKASGRLYLLSLHRDRPGVANGSTRLTLSTTGVAAGGGAIPGRAHSPFRTDKVHLNATTYAAHNVGRPRVGLVTGTVMAILSGVGSTSGVTRTGAVSRSLYRTFPLPCWGVLREGRGLSCRWFGRWWPLSALGIVGLFGGTHGNFALIRLLAIVTVVNVLTNLTVPTVSVNVSRTHHVATSGGLNRVTGTCITCVRSKAHNSGAVSAGNSSPGGNRTGSITSITRVFTHCIGLPSTRI